MGIKEWGKNEANPGQTYKAMPNLSSFYRYTYILIDLWVAKHTSKREYQEEVPQP